MRAGVVALLVIVLAGCLVEPSGPSGTFCPLPQGGIHGHGQDGQSDSGFYGYRKGIELRVVREEGLVYDASFCNRTGRTVWASEAGEPCPEGFVHLYVTGGPSPAWPESRCKEAYEVEVPHGHGWSQKVNLEALAWRGDFPAEPQEIRMYVSLPFERGGYFDGSWSQAAVTLTWPADVDFSPPAGPRTGP